MAKANNKTNSSIKSLLNIGGIALSILLLYSCKTEMGEVPMHQQDVATEFVPNVELEPAAIAQTPSITVATHQATNTNLASSNPWYHYWVSALCSKRAPRSISMQERSRKQANGTNPLKTLVKGMAFFALCTDQAFASNTTNTLLIARDAVDGIYTIPSYLMAGESYIIENFDVNEDKIDISAVLPQAIPFQDLRILDLMQGAEFDIVGTTVLLPQGQEIQIRNVRKNSLSSNHFLGLSKVAISTTLMPTTSFLGNLNSVMSTTTPSSINAGSVVGGLGGGVAGLGCCACIVYKTHKKRHVPPAHTSGPDPIVVPDDSPIRSYLLFIFANHPDTDKNPKWEILPADNPGIHLSYYIRRTDQEQRSVTRFLDALASNSHHDGRTEEVRPATAVGVLKSGKLPVTKRDDGRPVAIGLLGDAFNKCTWSEKGELIFKNTSRLVTAQKCDIASGEIELVIQPGGIDRTEFKRRMENRDKSPDRMNTHIEGKWLDSVEDLYNKMVHQGEKAVGIKPMGSSTKTEGGRIPGVPKNKYSNYRSHYGSFGFIPHNEAFLVFTLENIQAIGINTHSKQSVVNSLALYQSTVEYLKNKNRRDLVGRILLSVYNNRTGEVKQVRKRDIQGIYEHAPAIYSTDHARIHPDERP